MAKTFESTATLFCAVAICLFASFFMVNGQNKLVSGKKYKIISQANGLVMTAERGVYNKYLGIVHMEPYVPMKRTSFGTTALNEKNEKNSYNKVTTYHEKDSFHIYNDFEATVRKGNFYFLRQVTSQENREKQECLQNMGEGEAVQLLPCNSGNKDQIWKFELLP